MRAIYSRGEHPLYKRGKYPRGHRVRCKHCGHSFDEHENPETVRNPSVCRKNFNLAFSRCKRYGYEPANLERWRRLEAAYQKKADEDFKMACFEQDARRRSAWGTYAAHIRTENLKEELNEEFKNKPRTGEAVREFIDTRSTGGLYIG